MSEVDLLSIKRAKVTCKRCGTEVVFDIEDEEGRGRYIPANCPVCGDSYGMNPHNNVIERVRQAVSAAGDTKGARISIICEEEA